VRNERGRKKNVGRDTLPECHVWLFPKFWEDNSRSRFEREHEWRDRRVKSWMSLRGRGFTTRRNVRCTHDSEGMSLFEGGP
jgi:hypothetical protein